jgi:hypothetical protein
MPKLEIFQSLWAMELRRPDGKERSREECFEMIAAAGYDGVAVDLGSIVMDNARACLPFVQKHGLGCIVNAFPKTVSGLRPVLDMAKEFDARFVNIIGQVMPVTVEGAIPVIRAWMDQSEEAGMPVLFETHRNCITNDLLFTLSLLDAVPEMRLCADLSHFVVDREFPLPLLPRDRAFIDRILDRSDSFQGRVAGREQIQLPLAYPQHQKWVELFKGWWEQGIRGWRARAKEGEIFNFLCELGPPDYAMTGPDGYELSDRWEEALTIRGWVQDIWNRLEAEGA